MNGYEEKIKDCLFLEVCNAAGREEWDGLAHQQKENLMLVCRLSGYDEKFQRDCGLVTREQMEELIRAAQEAPSWKNSQTGRYYCVLSEEMVDKIRVECLPDAGNAGKSEHAALIVTTFVHDRAGFQKDGTADNELGNGWGCYDLGLQNENLVLKAVDLGLSTLIMGLREADRLREILNIPESETIVAVIAVGKAAEEPIHPQRKPIEEIAKFF